METSEEIPLQPRATLRIGYDKQRPIKWASTELGMREMGAANMAGIKKKLDALLTHEHSEIIALASVCSLIVGIVVVKLALGASYAEIWSWVQPTGIIGFLATIAFVFIGQLRQMRQQFRKS